MNKTDPAAHTLLRGDVREVLDDLARKRHRFDLAVVDPPTFSNSKRMTTTWDVQRDHVELLAAVTACIRPGGVIWFSTNRRRFALDKDVAARLPRRAQIEDLSEATIPPTSATTTSTAPTASRCEPYGRATELRGAQRASDNTACRSSRQPDRNR